MKYYLIISIFLLLSCSKDKTKYDVPCNTPTNNISISKQLIIGNWTWVSEYYVQPFTGNIFFKTPVSEGYTRQLNTNSSIIEFYKNNSVEQKYFYEFAIEKSITNYSLDTTNVLVFKDFITGQRSNYVHYKICNDTLTLNFQIRSDLNGQEKWAKKK